MTIHEIITFVITFTVVTVVALVFSFLGNNVEYKQQLTELRRVNDSLTNSVNIVSTDRVETSHTHGTGCLLSSAIALSLSIFGKSFITKIL